MNRHDYSKYTEAGFFSPFEWRRNTPGVSH